MQIFKNPNFDFVRWRWPALALSLVVILSGMLLIGTRGLQKGVDFEGGTIVILKFDQPPDTERIQSAVGDATVHERHRTGTEPVHDARPTEVSVEALSEHRTTVTFAEPGTVTFVCHLPGHEAYGMTSTIVVTGP